jgi:5'-phosphate synthase pdxT subunit
MTRIAVLAVQGAFAAHSRALAKIGCEPVLVKDASPLERIDGLVLPGGESTVQLAMIRRLGMLDALARLHRRGTPILATCAGLILLARAVTNPEQTSLGLIDVDVRRNGYGTQLDSFIDTSDDAAHELVFIRAPRIVRVGARVEVLARWRGEPVLVRQDNVTAATFHPELASCISKAGIHATAFGRAARPLISVVSPALASASLF